MTAVLEEGEWSAACLGRTFPPWKTRYPLYKRLGGPQGRSGWDENLVPTGIRSRTWTRICIYIYVFMYKGKVALIHATKAYRGCGCQPPPMFNFNIKRRWLVSLTSLSLYLKERTTDTHRKEAGWTPEQVWSFWGETNRLAMQGFELPTI